MREGMLIRVRSNRRADHIAPVNPQQNDDAAHRPGAWLREDVIAATGSTKAEVAQLLGIPLASAAPPPETRC
jgi:hypothetical protein